MKAESTLVYLLWSPPGQGPRERRLRLLGECAPAILAQGVAGLQINLDDELADLPSPAPPVLFERPICAELKVRLGEVEQRFEVEDRLRREGFGLAGYLVDEQVYTDYGGNRHAAPRSWPDGERSPGILAVTLLERPRRLSREEWLRRWHGRQSPMSEAMQPRTRYVRNVVERCLTPGAPRFEGIVEEDWPSFAHVRNPFLFYGAGNPLALARNMAVMLHSVASFLDLWRIRTVTMSEYFLKTDFAG